MHKYFKGVSGPRLAFVGGLIGIGIVALWMAQVPQRPDGDLTALARFDTLYPSTVTHRLRTSFAYHLCGALVAWGTLGELSRALCALWERRTSHLAGQFPAIAGVFFWVGLLVVWSGWALNQSRGWVGDLFLEPARPTALGEDDQPVITFESFTIPPASDGPGRALAMRLLVAELPYDITEQQPYRGRGWTVTPRWFGATVTSPSMSRALFFGGDGTQMTHMVSGDPVTITLSIDPLAVSADPPVDTLSAHHHAIVHARFGPGDVLVRLGAVLTMAGAAGVSFWLARR